MKFEYDDPDDEPCMAEAAAKNNPYSNTVMVSCSCPKCTPRC